MYFFILLLFLFNIGCGPRSNPIYNQSSKLDEPDNHDQNEESENLHWDQLFFDDTTSKFLYTFYINYPSGLLKYRFFMDLHTLQVDAFEDNKEITPPRFNCLYIVSGFCSKFEIDGLPTKIKKANFEVKFITITNETDSFTIKNGIIFGNWPSADKNINHSVQPYLIQDWKNSIAYYTDEAFKNYALILPGTLPLPQYLYNEKCEATIVSELERSVTCTYSQVASSNQEVRKWTIVLPQDL